MLEALTHAVHLQGRPRGLQGDLLPLPSNSLPSIIYLMKRRKLSIISDSISSHALLFCFIVIIKLGKINNIVTNIRAGEPANFLLAPAPEFFFKRLRLLILFLSSSGSASWFFFQEAPAPRRQKHPAPTLVK